MDNKKIEQKWQEKWEKAKIFDVKESSKKKFYVLEMFPYPSGSGLHMGHAFNYTIGDIFARLKRMQGFNVLYPMGYDSFGLPAENAAIKAGTHPKEYTEKAISNFIVQQKLLGLSYDWTRLIKTHDPSYYKWDQWIFVKMFEDGLVYKKKAPVNWCPKCETALANEQVHDGKCWRHTETTIEVKPLEQWFMKITDYAEELYDSIEKLKGWPDEIKAMQKNWIGKSYGTEISFEINGKKWPIFTTRPDTIYGVTFMVISAQHPELMEIVTKDQKSTVVDFLKKIVSTSQKDTDLLEKDGVFTGSYAVNPLTKEKIPVYAGNFVVADYGSGMVMAVPAHDQRDFEFAKKYKIPIKTVINDKNPKGTILLIHGICGSSKENWFPWFKQECEKNGYKVLIPDLPNAETPKIEEWLAVLHRLKKEFSGDLIIIGHSLGCPVACKFIEEANLKFKKLIMVAPTGKSQNETQWKNLRGVGATEPVINCIKKFNDVQFNWNKIKNNVEQTIVYLSGNDPFVPLSVQENYKSINPEIKLFINKGHFNWRAGIVQFPEIFGDILSKAYVDEGILVNSGKFNGMNNKEAIDEITNYLEKSKLGKKKVQYKLRDWLISRQRYWGTPIPIIECKKCGPVPVPEKDLPVELPMDVKFGKGNPLLTNEKWINVKCPNCKEPAKRVTDTMDTFVNSSWYFLRYCDPKNDKKIFDGEKVKYWTPVDQYIGGTEHACMHLIYFRFYTKFLRDIGLLTIDEPVVNLFNQGMLHGPDGRKMSKSFGNVVLPEDVSKKYGIDTARLFLVSMSSPDKDVEWNDKGIESTFKFMSKFSGLLDKEYGKDGIKDKFIKSKTERTIQDVTKYIESFKYNIAVREIMDLVHYIHRYNDHISKDVFSDTFKKLVLISAPFVPHMCEELWSKLGNKGFISLESFPKPNIKLINVKVEASEEVVNQVIKDVEEIKKLTKMEAGKIKIFVAAPWKYEVYNLVAEEKTLKDIMREEKYKKLSKYVVNYVARLEKRKPLDDMLLTSTSEKDALDSSKEFLEKQIGCKIEIIAAADTDHPKALAAEPGKPGILIE